MKLKISTGDIAEISQLNKKEDVKPYITMVENYDGLNTVLVNTPISQGSYVRLSQNEKYIVKFISSKGIFRILASVNKYTPEEDTHFIEFKLFGKSKRLQQRNFYRLPCSNNINFQIRIEDESGINFSDDMNNGIILDLSGGGMKMSSKINIDIHKIIMFNLQIGDKKYKYFGQIMVKSVNRNAIQPYTYGVMFLGVSEIDMAKLGSYLHHQQLKSLQLS